MSTLMLGGADLVVGVLDADPLPLEGEHGLAADVDPGVERGEVEVATLVEDFGRAVLRLGGAVEVLELGADEVVVEPHLLARSRARRMVQRGSPS